MTHTVHVDEVLTDHLFKVLTTFSKVAKSLAEEEWQGGNPGSIAKKIGKRSQKSSHRASNFS